MSRPVRSLVTVELPLPPSVNKAFASAKAGSKKILKTAAYTFWTRQVQDELGDGSHLPCLVSGKFGLWIDLNEKMVGDIDNRIKLLADVLRSPGGHYNERNAFGLCITPDDAHMDDLHVCRRGAPPDRCIATVVTLADWPSYLEMRLL